MVLLKKSQMSQLLKRCLVKAISIRPNITKKKKLFVTYHQSFKLGSKPAAHIDALAKLNDDELLAKMPESLIRLADAVIAKLAELPE